MSVDFNVNAVSRSDTGKGASRRLRRTGQVPAIVYGAGQDPEQISVKHNELIRHLEDEAFYSHILTLDVDGKKQKVVLKDLQRHPAKPFVIHADFLRISAKESIRMQVPLHFINEDTAPGVKAGGAVSHAITAIEVVCLPQDLPEFIEVDMGEMNIGDIIHLSEIVLPAGVEHSHAQETDPVVVNVQGARAEETDSVEEESSTEDTGGESAD